MNEILKAITEWADSFERDFLALERALSKSLRRAEAAILRRILADVLPTLGIADGFLKSGISNIAKANLIERVFDAVGRDEINAALIQYSDALLAITGKNAAYYYSIGYDTEKVKALAADTALIRGIIGIDRDGKILKDGFLYRLGRSEAVREKIKGYVVTSIASRQSLKQFGDGLKNMVSGGQGVPGAISAYWQNYAYDAYSQVREVDNLHFKEEIGLKHFVYQGGLIKTSRDFCIKKNGKAFKEADAVRDWPKDPDLIDKAHAAAYRPIIDRGRYNCRHFLMWISEDYYNELTKDA